jgi:actin related protein 2/3 complex, subunit 5
MFHNGPLYISRRNDIAGALNVILFEPPYGPNVDEAKVRTNSLLCGVRELTKVIYSSQSLTLNALLLILNSTKATDISGILRNLDMDQQDTLMKYLYKGMGSHGLADVNGSVLLSWHEKVCNLCWSPP